MKREELKRYTSSEIEEIDDALLESSEDGIIKMTRVYIASEADSVMDAYEKRIKELEAENARLKAQVPKWHVLANGDFPKSDVKKFLIYDAVTKKYGKSFFSFILKSFQFDVTHWMPLPPPPTTEESSATEKENG